VSMFRGRIRAASFDIPRFSVLRSLMCASAPQTQVEGILRQMAAQGQEESQSQATRLVALATNAGVELFHTPEGDSYATIEVDGHRETWPLKVRRFRRWLADLFNEEEEKVPGSQAVQDALAVLEGKALKGQELPVFLRLAEHQGAIYLDLGNAAWQAIEITPR